LNKLDENCYLDSLHSKPERHVMPKIFRNPRISQPWKYRYWSLWSRGP